MIATGTGRARRVPPGAQVASGPARPGSLQPNVQKRAGQARRLHRGSVEGAGGAWSVTNHAPRRCSPTTRNPSAGHPENAGVIPDRRVLESPARTARLSMRASHRRFGDTGKRHRDLRVTPKATAPLTPGRAGGRVAVDRHLLGGHGPRGHRRHRGWRDRAVAVAPQHRQRGPAALRPTHRGLRSQPGEVPRWPSRRCGHRPGGCCSAGCSGARYWPPRIAAATRRAAARATAGSVAPPTIHGRRRSRRLHW